MSIKPTAAAHALAFIGTLAAVIAAAHLLTGQAQVIAQLVALVLGGSAVYGVHAATLTPPATPAAPATPPASTGTGLGALMPYVVQIAGGLDTAEAEQALAEKFKAIVADPAAGVTASAASFEHLGVVNLSAPDAPAEPTAEERYQAADTALKAALDAGDVAAAQAAYAQVQEALAAEAEPSPSPAPEAPASPVAL